MRRAAIATTIAAILIAPLFVGAAATAQNEYVDVTDTTAVPAGERDVVRGEVVTPQVTEQAEPQAQQEQLPVTGSDVALFLLGGAGVTGLAIFTRRLSRRAAAS